MVFREKLRKVMSRSSDNSSNSSKSGSGSTSSSTTRKSSLFYQPGEVIPYKYRRPVAKEHKEKLDAFSFASSWRRKSHTSQYSPMGSRAVSRRNSVASQLRRGFAKRAHGSVGSVGSERGVGERGTTTNEAVPPEDSVVGKDFADPAPAVDPSQYESPFSQEELSLALQRSHLGVPPRG